MLRKDEKPKDSNWSEELIAFLGKGTEFKGLITFEGTIRIDGKVEGEIITKGTLVVGETAVIEAEVNAGKVVCGGKIKGNVVASEKVQLLSPAVVSGTVRTPVLSMEEGVQFNGTCEMGQAPAAAQPGQDAKGPKSQETKTPQTTAPW